MGHNQIKFTLALLVGFFIVLTVGLALAANCGDYAQYCSVYAGMYGALVNSGNDASDSEVRQMADTAYSLDSGEKVLDVYHETGSTLFRFGVTDRDTAYSLCDKVCKDDPSMASLAGRLARVLEDQKQQQEGPELK